MKRRRIPEEMDDPAVAESDHAHALQSLNRVNRLLAVHRRQHQLLGQLAATPSVLDLGCGGGGFLGYLALQKGFDRPALLIGLDRSVFALKCAQTWNPSGIHAIASDARHIPFADQSIDVVTCSLFLHHFDPADAAAILHDARRVARKAIIVADLARSWTAWTLTWVMTRLLSRSWIFHVDGPRSVRAAFRPAELADIARRAGLAPVTVKSRFPFRLLLTWTRPETTNGPRKQAS